ncbi:MAG TPA: hypothetical protein EYG03_07475, partial [Planctomycetes bacterium]|nr:hypothetical protein [Planctomycetota bacterium]
DMVVQPDGKIVVAGYSVNGNYNGVTVVRYNPDGSRDSSFDGDGRVYTSLGTGRHFVTSVALQADGKLVAAGYFGSSASSDNDLAVVRYNTDGSLDTSFDGDGMLTVDYGSTQDVGSDVTIQSDGKLVVTGRTGNAVLVARLNSDGTPDTTFGSGGSLTTSIQASASGSSVVVQPDGNIVVAGTANNGNGNQFLNRDFAVVRYGVSLSTEEDTSALFSGLLVSDVDAGSSELSVSLSVGDGALALLSSNGLSFTDSDGSDGTLAFTGTQTDINAALAALEYTGNLNFHGQDTLQITVNDQGHTGTDPGLSGGATSEEATMTVAITVTPINDAPTVTAGGTLGYVENDAATVVDATLTLADVDDVNLESATVAITGGFQSSEDSLGFTDQNGITGSYSAATGVLTLSGTATVADYQAALAPVTYFNSSEDPDETNRTVSFTVNDGDVDSLAATSTVTVEAVDDLISIAHANDANETGSAVGKFTVTQSEIRATNTVITYSVLASSTASAAGTDYGTLSGTVTIMAGDITADIDVTGISDDLIVESDETINVQLTGTTTPSFIIDTANDTATVTILDHDSATLSIGDASVTEGHSGTTTLSFPVTLSREVDVDVLVDYTTQDGTATTADGDYVAQTGTLTINRAGDIAGTIDIAINGDTSIELDETLSLILSNLQANGRDVVLVDAPTAGAGIVQFDASSLGLANGNVVSNWGGQTAGGTPTYLAGQTPNGGAAVQFNGSDRFGDNIIVPASAAGDFIYVAVVKANNTGGYHNLVDDDIGVRPMLWIDPSFNYELNYSGGVGAKAVGTGTDGWDTATATNGNNNCFAAEEL